MKTNSDRTYIKHPPKTRSLSTTVFNNYYFTYFDGPSSKHFNINMSTPASLSSRVNGLGRCHPRYGSNSSDSSRCGSAATPYGRTPYTVLISPGLTRHLSEVFTYVVSHFGQWVEVNALEGPQYSALGFQIFTVDTMIAVTDWTKPQPAPSTENAFTRQYEEIDQAESKPERIANWKTNSTLDA